MTASNSNNVILSKNGLVVTVCLTDDEEILSKSLSLITPPKSTGIQETNPLSDTYGPNVTKIADLLNKAEKRIIINGYLDSSTGETGEKFNAEDKKNDLKNIVFGGGTFTMNYEGVNLTGNTERISIKRVNKTGYTGLNEFAEFSVQFTFIKGENLQTG